MKQRFFKAITLGVRNLTVIFKRPRVFGEQAGQVRGRGKPGSNLKIKVCRGSLFEV